MEAHKARILKDFSGWFREAAEEIGGTQVDLARTLGVTQEQVSRWKNGKFAPTLVTMREIARKLKRPLPPGLIGEEPRPAVFESRSRRFVSLRREARAIAAAPRSRLTSRTSWVSISARFRLSSAMCPGMSPNRPAPMRSGSASPTGGRPSRHGRIG